MAQQRRGGGQRRVKSFATAVQTMSTTLITKM